MLDMTSLLMGRARILFCRGLPGAYVLDLRSDYTQTDTWHYNVLVQRSHSKATAMQR